MFNARKVAQNSWVVWSTHVGIPMFPGELLMFPSEHEAREVAVFMQEVYEAGRRSVQDPIRRALGIDE